MKHTAFAFGFASFLTAGAAHPLCAAPAHVPAPHVIRPVLVVSAEIAMPNDDVRAWIAPTAAAPDTTADRRALRRRERREHARRHDAVVRAGLSTLLVREHGHDDATHTGLATLLAPAPGQANISLQRPLLGDDERPMPGNVMTKQHGKHAGPDWTDE